MSETQYYEEIVFQSLTHDAHWIINKKMARTIGITDTLLLADLISKHKYFLTRGQLDDDGFFYNTQENIEKDTSLSDYQQLKIIKKLIALEFITTKKRGLPAKLYYKLNFEKILSFLVSKKLDSDKLGINNNKDNNTIINNSKSDSDESPKKILTHPIMDYWNSLETTRKHLKANSKVYKTAIRYLKQLNTGTFGKMVTLKVEQKLSSTDRIKKWTNDEIKQVLDITLLVFQAGYWPTDKSQIPTDLASLIYNPRSQFSWFLRCWKNPPQAIEQQIEIISKDEKALSLYQQVFNLSSQKMNRRLVLVVNALYDWYTKKMLQYPSASFDAHFGTFERFAKKHCEWLYTQGKDIHISYCKLDAQNFTRFLDSIQKNYGYNLNPTDEQRKKIQQQIDMQQQQIQSARKARGRK